MTQAQMASPTPGAARKQVVVTEPIHPDGLARLAAAVEVVRPPDLAPATLAAALATASGIVVRLAKVPAELIAAAPLLEVVGKHGVGVDNIDLAAAGRRGIPVVTTPVATEGAVAEHAIALILALARRLRESEAGLRAGHFFATRDSVQISDLAGKTLGIVGVGRIGGRLAEIAWLGFRMRVLGFDPFAADERLAALGVERRAALPELLAESDFVSVHVPLGPETRGLLGAAELAHLRPTAFLVNCARGGVVDEAALAAALAAGRLAGAGLDVFAVEPPSLDHPLFRLPGVLVTPHVAGGSADALRLTATTVAEEVLRVLGGERPRYVANRRELGWG